MSSYVSVAVPVPHLGVLTYEVPEGAVPPARGARVLVPLGARQVTGCAIAAVDPPAGGVDVKPLLEVLDEGPFLPGPIVDLALWAAEYYAAGPGEALAAAMPPLAWIESRRRYVISDAGQARLSDDAPRASGAALLVLRALAKGSALTARDLAAAGGNGGGSIDAALRALVRDGLVEVRHGLTGRAAAFRTERIAVLTAQGQDVAASLQPGEASAARSTASELVGPRQAAALAALAGAPGGLGPAALRERGVSSDTLKRLAARGLVTFREDRRERDPFAGDAAGASAAVEHAGRQLTGEQAAAFERLRGHVGTRRFHAALLHGVTGSGKTELYVRLAALALAGSRRALVLVPEIALTPAVAAIFRGAFGSRVAIQHSGLSDGERHDQWHRIRDGHVDVVVGTRSAVFAPLDRTGLIIVDEEHDASYKQQETPRYNGRDLAVVRGRQESALVVLGSATPSIESYRNALEGRYELIALERRVLDRPLASVQVVNMRDELAAAGPEVVLSAALVHALAARGAAGEQALLLLNRRGFSTTVFCRQCGATVDCPNCSVSLTVHHPRRGAARAQCHYCNYSIAVPKACARCAAPYLEHIGFGTEKVEAEVRRLLPALRVARVDRDTMQRRGAIQSVLASFARREIDVIVGTQMIAKGHDFPAVTLVGVVSADVGLGLPDFRASERTFQLLTQVVGRAGRGEVPGEAVIQTFFPEHYSIQLAMQQDYRAFYAREIAFRQAMRYPPAVGLINAIVRGRTFGLAMTAAADLASHLRAGSERGRFTVLGPAPAPLGRLRGEYRAQLLLKGRSRAAMRQAVQRALSGMPELQRRVSIDVDPLSVM